MFDRKQHWENIYHSRSPEKVSWYQTTPQRSLALIRSCTLESGDPIIDIGGGASRLIDHLVQDGYQDLSVLDISATALRHAQQRLGDNARQVHWIESDITEFQPPRRFTLWHDRAVFHFLTQAADRAQYVTTLRQALPSGGQLILASFAVGGPVKCSGLDIVQYDADRLLDTLGAGFELLEEQSENHLTPDHAVQAFKYFRLVKLS
ncbi:MAG: class I SAM-dependent methyltransferase [Candidatus Thiodiazotropha sp.]|jgi:SAM-dependent methyltransferase